MLNIFKSFGKSDVIEEDDTCVASQKVLNDLSPKFDGKTPVRIFFLDNSSKLFLLKKGDTVRDTILMILEKLCVYKPKDIVQFFGIYISEDGVNVGHPLSLDDEIVTYLTDKNKLSKNGDIDRLKVVFMIRLHVPSIWGLELDVEKTTITDESLLYLQYIQAIYNIITGQYSVTAEEALKLGAIHFILKLGFFNKLIHEVGYIGNRIVEFIPVKLMKLKTLNEWEQLLLDSVYNVSNEIKSENNIKDDIDNSTIMAKYLGIILNMDIYGQTFYKCSQHTIRSLPEKPIIGIHIEGVSIYDKMKKLLVHYSLIDIIRWGFKPNVHFYFEIDPEQSAGILQPFEKGIFFFETVDGQHIADLLSDYAQAFMIEEEKIEQDVIVVEKVQKRISFADIGSSKIADKISSSKNSSNIQSPVSPVTPVSTFNNNQSVRRKSKFNIFTAVVAIQSLYRGYALRRDWIREDAAIFIQSVYRGHRARVRISKIIEAMLND